MEDAMYAIIQLVRECDDAGPADIDRLMRSSNKGLRSRIVSKRRLLPFYLRQRREMNELYHSWAIDEALHARIVGLLRSKPGRTASGVATVSVLMKPWPCGGDCAYCPNDIRMPKSYLSSEPACQRAEQAFFDPYLQVVRRLSVLADMGHNTDKVELIVLGGTFDDYSREYREWFVHQLFEGLNGFSEAGIYEACSERELFYRGIGLECDPSLIEPKVAPLQKSLDRAQLGYNEAISSNPYWGVDERRVLDTLRCARTLEEEHARNESAACKCVGLVVETRPECITRESLEEKRSYGCTKVQIGVQSLDPRILKANCRNTSLDDIAHAFSLLREYGFKSHVHLMQNLPGSSASADLADFMCLIQDPRFKPDEVKLYPCALVESAKMTAFADDGIWDGYETRDLVRLLSDMVKATPRHMRISRMIRDIPSSDIIAGNKVTNLRQLVEEGLRDGDVPCEEMRMREIRTDSLDTSSLTLRETRYETSNTQEAFLEFVDPDDRLAGFLRLSLPSDQSKPAMIREVHVYGKAARIGEPVDSAQHTGLGKRLISAALSIARAEGRPSLKVISAIGTREYYRSLGFSDDGLYQRHAL